MTCNDTTSPRVIFPVVVVLFIFQLLIFRIQSKRACLNLKIALEAIGPARKAFLVRDVMPFVRGVHASVTSASFVLFASLMERQWRRSIRSFSDDPQQLPTPLPKPSSFLLIL